VLKLEPSREEEARYWLANLAVNAAVMRAIDSDDPAKAAERCEPSPERRHRLKSQDPRARHR
jgi:hypothetical protein